jgi:hypothetical protein
VSTAAATIARAGAQFQPLRFAHWTRAAAVTFSARAYRAAGRGKALAAAEGVHVSTACRYQQGVVYSPLAKALRTLAEHPRTTAYPALVEALTLVNMTEIGPHTRAELLRRRAELIGQKFELDSLVMRAAYDGDEDMAEDAHASLAALHLELLAIVRTLKERGS